MVLLFYLMLLLIHKGSIVWDPSKVAQPARASASVGLDNFESETTDVIQGWERQLKCRSSYLRNQPGKAEELLATARTSHPQAQRSDVCAAVPTGLRLDVCPAMVRC